MLIIQNIKRHILIACCIFHQHAVYASCKKATRACVAQCSHLTRIMVPSFYPATLRSAREEQLNKQERLNVLHGVQTSLDKMKNPASMNIDDVHSELKKRIDYLDAKYFDIEQLPGKHAPLDHKITYTTEINRVRQLQIAIRDKKEKRKQN
jgi:hypothetical protein